MIIKDSIGSKRVSNGQIGLRGVSRGLIRIGGS